MLAALRRQGKPLSAYEILARLNRKNSKLAPPTIYRA
ncbi:MAG: transcriptional repressor, partial [Rhodospirillaceae bacterium]|nr:transcriptional repressor [Rhodospirillaceae bacterium]